MQSATLTGRKVAGVGCLVLTLPLLVVAAPVIAAVMAWRVYWKGVLRRRFVHAHGPSVSGILVYSDSPNWKAYIEAQWLPRIGNRMYVMNWSQRSRWRELHPLESRVCRSHLGDRDYNPVAIIFQQRDTGAPSVEIIRFFAPFRDHKHGNDAALRRAEARMWELLGSTDAQSDADV